MKHIPTPVRLMLFICIMLFACSPAALAADCGHNNCSDGSCDYTVYDTGYAGKPVGNRPIRFDTINICEDELCRDGNCGNTHDQPLPCPNDCSRCDDADDCDTCRRCRRYAEEEAEEPLPCPYDCSRCDDADDCDTCRRCRRYAEEEEADDDHHGDGTLCWGDDCEDEDNDRYPSYQHPSDQKPSYQRPGYSSNSYSSLFSAISSIMQGNTYWERFSPLLQMLMGYSYNSPGYTPNYNSNHNYCSNTDSDEDMMQPNHSYIDADLIRFRNEVLRLVNAERAAAGLPALKSHSALNGAAQIRADEISTDYGHDRPDGSSCFTVLQEKAISYNSAGENIASGQTTPEQVVREWMNSPGHRANILNTKYTYLGIGITKNTGGSYGGYSWAQMFIG